MVRFLLPALLLALALSWSTRFTARIGADGLDLVLVAGSSPPLALWDGARSALGGYRLHLVLAADAAQLIISIP